MDAFWDKALPTAVGALIGGFVTILAIVVKEWMDRRRSVQSWFEDVFIFQGIAELISYLSAVEDLLLTLGLKDILLAELFPSYPRVALDRFLKLFPNVPGVVTWFRIVRSESAKSREGRASDDQGIQHALEWTSDLKRILEVLERELLGIRLKRKPGIYEIKDNKRIRPLLARLDEKKKYPDSLRMDGA
jgi:hypothetical protein